MILNSISLKNYRIHKDTQINFSDSINYIVGGNGQGKTSILEAIYYLCTTKGYNAFLDLEAVRFEETFFEVAGNFIDYSDNNVRVYYTAVENKKYFFINGKQIYRAADVIGKYPVVILTPEDHSITQGSPGDRRKFIDSVISQSSETYLQLLLEYNKTLRQRSSLLSQIKENRDRNQLTQLEAWSSRLVQTGSEIIKHRIKFIGEFNDYVKSSYSFIMDTQESPAIEYYYFDGKFSGESIEQFFFKMIEQKSEDEIRRGSNLVGPHRDDFLFSVNTKDLKKFGSQGQNKTFQVTLRFAQFFYLKDKLGKVPIFLMDDVFGELDVYRASKISSYLKDIGQAFVTLTDLANFSNLIRTNNDSVIKVHKGTISYA